MPSGKAGGKNDSCRSIQARADLGACYQNKPSTPVKTHQASAKLDKAV